ncbi:MAG: PepSY domain-containing protein [Clostridium sp.]|nr:PepSY domain-containing protein [Clostridium sp.]
MKMRRVFTMIFMMICLVSAGILVSPYKVYAKKITSISQAEKKALKEVKNAVVTEVDKDYEKGTLVYEIHLMKGKKEYDITYRASDGKMVSYGWEQYNVSPSNNKKIISKSKCRKLAQKKVKKAKITSLVRKYDDGIVVYKVKLKKGDKKYELKYHARTGKLIEYDWEITLKKAKKKDTYIGVDKAKSIALEKVPGAVVVKVEFDKDDGVPVYEVELLKDEFEYEIKIHAKTGKILEIEREYNDRYYYDY